MWPSPFITGELHFVVTSTMQHMIPNNSREIFHYSNIQNKTSRFISAILLCVLQKHGWAVQKQATCNHVTIKAIQQGASRDRAWFATGVHLSWSVYHVDSACIQLIFVKTICNVWKIRIFQNSPGSLMEMRHDVQHKQPFPSVNRCGLECHGSTEDTGGSPPH